MKRLMVIGAAALLGACGGQDVRMPAAVGNLVKPGTAPWLSVTGGANKLDVRGLDHKLILEPSPDTSVALQSQLGARLQSSYFQDLVVTCSALTAVMRVDQDKAPGHVSMDLALHCSVWARGFDANHDYKAQVSTAAAAADDQAYAQAVPALLSEGADAIAEQLRADLRTIGHAQR
ncbi:hypothetical protein ISP15_10770 [Dyella jejuensis]|uniref:ABC-type transport auxiliary lipoprotein component domain-containing protein n=1 Tax=Dyella jejuensis TaxID=1432009 RepID=A0ABW8JLT3_9GAMM